MCAGMYRLGTARVPSWQKETLTMLHNEALCVSWLMHPLQFTLPQLPLTRPYDYMPRMIRRAEGTVTLMPVGSQSVSDRCRLG